MAVQETEPITINSFGEDSETGVEIVDTVARRRILLRTPTSVNIHPTDGNQFIYPIDTAVKVQTERLTANTAGLKIKDSSGELSDMTGIVQEELSKGQYTIEVSAPMKMYIYAESALRVNSNGKKTTIDFDEGTEAMIGARSYHERPAATVTTTADPKDMMRAISTFGSALKTTSPERSFPTLRGHPPTIELGDGLDLAGLEPPETGVTIEVPPEYHAIFTVSSLAYYLGARVRPGDDPVIRIDTGFEHSLDKPGGFEQTVERTFKQVFFLDCLTRTEGLYPIDLYEREAIEADIGLDFGALYDRPLAEQLEAYLAVPFETVGPEIPEWKRICHVEPIATSVEMLPFLANSLAIMRCRTPDEATASSPAGEPSESTDAPRIGWVGNGFLPGADKPTVTGHLNRFKRTPSDDQINITVICNETSMDDEHAPVDNIYADQTDLLFDIDLKYNLSTAELTDELAADTDFLHYIGHVNSDGFECANGTLDAGTLDTVGVDAFLLNACQSYRQGMALIEAGGIGGIVTSSNVLNSEAVSIGRTVARLLNAGFDLYAAIGISSDENKMAARYTVLGDGEVTIAQSSGGPPNVITIQKDKQGYELTVENYPTSEYIGGISKLVGIGDEHYLVPGKTPTFRLKKDEVKDFLNLETVPVRIGQNLHWSDQLELTTGTK